MYDEFLNFIFPLAKGAGEIQLAYFRGDDLGIETKSNAYDVVTRADKESEAYIVQAILGRYPGHGILGEEGGVMGTAGSDYRWVIDPLDGTTNYSQGPTIPRAWRGSGVSFRPGRRSHTSSAKGGC